MPAVNERDETVRAFIEARRRALLRSAYLLCGNLHEAEDLVQTTLVKVVMAGRRLERLDNVEAYTRKALMSVFIGSRRRRWHREKPHATVPDRPAPGTDPELALAVRAALSAVPPRQRAVLVLRHWEDLSVEETAHVLGVSEGTVKSQNAKGLATMRAALRAALPDAGARFADPEEAARL
ncbi:SigE family RNA polymerase sigma factor [Yinghuangia soli]|uniref:SigE family RNA polymerase sigma factor n=1 Tax=Yinghuangia soli TaxID=2908204 RepID=A0AA41PV92_9ACTN|nr:SigE family RNA polymerase sigma factor [Yinghuangia soli]MCF2526480.1 SigE family RNA polymerase sigma factor [Yinghuangia soli]